VCLAPGDARARAEAPVPSPTPARRRFDRPAPLDPAVTLAEHASMPFTRPRPHPCRTGVEGARRLVARGPVAPRDDTPLAVRSVERSRAPFVYGDADAEYVPFPVAPRTVFPRRRPVERARLELEGRERDVHGFLNLPLQHGARERALDGFGRSRPQAGAAHEAAMPGGAGGR